MMSRRFLFQFRAFQNSNIFRFVSTKPIVKVEHFKKYPIPPRHEYADADVHLKDFQTDYYRQRMVKLDHSSINNYLIPPRLPYVDGYLKDVRTDRQLISTLPYTNKNGEKKQLRIELLDETDIPLAAQYYADSFMKDCSIMSELKGTYDEFAPFFFDDVAPKIPAQMSMLVKDEEKVVGFHVNDCISKEDFDKHFTDGTHMPKPILDIKDDYGEDIKNGPYKSHKCNQLLRVCEIPIQQTLRFLPPDVNRILLFEVVGILKEYQNYGIFPVLVKQMEKLGKERGCDYGITYCVAKESATILQKVWKHLFTFPYNKYKDNGKLVYDKLPYGAEGIVVCYKKL